MPLGLNYGSSLLQLAAAYKAKLLCSGIFVSKRQLQDLLSEDLAVDSLWPLRCFKSTVNIKEKTVTVSCAGLGRQTALYRPGLGSTLVLDTSIKKLRRQSDGFSRWLQKNPLTACDLPVAKTPHSEVNKPQLTKAINAAFLEPNQKKLQRTRAVVVVHKGEIIAERYAAGISKTTPLLGWSMAKSVINALIGVLVQRGTLSLDSNALLPEWRSPDDPRRKITLDQLLHMSSGLDFSEDYANPLSDVTTMLFRRGDMASYAAGRSLANAPGNQFSYSSGSTILLCRIIKEALIEKVSDEAIADYLSFPQRALFDPLGMSSAVLEPDTARTFTGSSFMYATAADWAKLGLLYLQDGRWAVNGKWTRLLPEGWVKYSTAASETAPYYGAHFWRGVPLSFATEDRNQSSWPPEAYLASGYQGQFLTVIPSKELVVVRLGLSQQRNSWDHEKFIEQIAKAVALSSLG